MSTPDPRSFLPLHPLEFRILLVLLEGQRHAYRIVKEVEERGPEGERIFPANLYRRLRDMLDRGVLEEVPIPARADQRRRRYFRITALGEAVARAEAARLDGLVAGARALGLLEPARR